VTYGDRTSVFLNKKTGRWVAEYRLRLPGGNIKRIQRRFNTRDEAIEGAHQLKAQYPQGKAFRDSVRVGDLIDSYLRHQLNVVRPHTAANYKQLLDLYVRPVWGGRCVDSISTADLIDLLDSLRFRGLRASTINTVKARVSGLFSYAMRIEVVSRNIASGVSAYRKLENETTLKKEPWSISEAKEALMAFVDSEIDLYVHISVTLGLRMGEIRALRWGDVDFEKGTISVTKSRGERRVFSPSGELGLRTIEHETKTRSAIRALGIPPLLLLAFMRELHRLEKKGRSPLSQQHLIIGPKKNLPISQATLNRVYNRVCAEMGLRRIRLYDHRHTAIVAALNSGASYEIASQGAGHSAMDITRRVYAPYVQRLADGYSSALSTAFDLDAVSSTAQGVQSGGGVNVDS
jgi:integrase